MDIYEIVKEHLKKPTGIIAVTQGSNKLQRPKVKHHKYNWNLKDILNVSSGVEDFFENYVKPKGFGNGAILSLRNTAGTSHKTKHTIMLQIKDAPTGLSKPETTNKNSNNNNIMGHEDNTQQSSQNAPAGGMGYTQVPSHEFISLKVVQERYNDISDKLRRAEKERDEAESKLRSEKEKTLSLERKLDTLEDRHQLAIERLEVAKKGFLDTPAGQEAMKGLAASLPVIAESLVTRGQQPQQAAASGLSNPQVESPVKQQFIKSIVVPSQDEVLEAMAVIMQAMNIDEMYAEETFEKAQSIVELNSGNNE